MMGTDTGDPLDLLLQNGPRAELDKIVGCSLNFAPPKSKDLTVILCRQISDSGIFPPKRIHSMQSNIQSQVSSGKYCR